MKPFNKPMIALSATEADAGLIRYADRVGRLGSCEQIRVVHVVPTDHPTKAPATAGTIARRLADGMQASFRNTEARWEYDVVHGPRLDKLVELSADHHIDLAVVGHRLARSGQRSLARRMAMIAPCSVWLVPEGSPDRVTNIMVPIDFSSHSADALSVATALAAEREINHCLAVHVFFDPSTIRYDEHLEEIQGREQAAFQQFLSQIDVHGVQVEPIFEESTHPTEAILRVVRRYKADLIVMNTRGRSRAAAILLGSITSGTMAVTTVPLLAVKHYGSRMTALQAVTHPRYWEPKSPKAN